MRALLPGLVIVALSAPWALAAPGDTWILGIDHIDNFGFFQTFTGAGYQPDLTHPQSAGNSQYNGNAYGPPITCSPCQDGVARIYWKLDGLSTNNGNPLPSTTELYSIKFYGTAQPTNNDWQPIESQFRGVDGELWPNDPLIPWAGEGGQNHQWIGADAKTVGSFVATGPGPHTPSSANYNASGFNGSYMWLKSGSWLYAKWNLGFDIKRSWSAIQLTQITPVIGPPPTGDYNQNNYVDAADYVLWRKTYDDSNYILGRPADGNHDGWIDEYDYDIWRRHFGDKATGLPGPSPSLVGIPEPATFGLSALAAVALLAAPRCRRRSAIAQVNRPQVTNCGH